MDTYAQTYPAGTEFPISAFFWGALILVALVAAWILAANAIGWLKTRRKFDAEAVVDERPESPKDWSEQAISRPPADHGYAPPVGSSGLGGLGGMNQREQEILFSSYGRRKVRKAIKQRHTVQQQKHPKRSQ